MTDLQHRLNELDLLEVPEMRADIERRAARLLASPQESLHATDPISPSWRGPMIALGTALGILVIVAASLLALNVQRTQVTETTVEPTATTTAPPETTSPPTTTAMPQSASALRHAGSAEDVGWTVIERPISGNQQHFRRLASGLWVSVDVGWQCRNEHGFSNACSLGTGTPASASTADPVETLWTSADGIEWESAALPEFVGKVVYSAYVADGTHGQLWVWVSPTDEFTPTEVWLTDDAATWRKIRWNTSEPVPPNYWFWPDAITRLDNTIFLTASFASQTTHFVSTDRGRTFTEITPFTAGSYVIAHWSAAGEIRALVDEPEEGLALWSTQTGQDWERIHDVIGVPQSPLTVISSPDGLIAHQQVGSQCARPLLNSIDGGLTWNEIDIFGALPIHHDAAFMLVQSCTYGTADGWILAQSNDLVWVSRNGIDWYTIDGNPVLVSLPHRSGVHTDQGWVVPPIE